MESAHTEVAVSCRTLFMQPQFIIDAIKYVIREPNPKNINEKLKEKNASNRKSIN